MAAETRYVNRSNSGTSGNGATNEEDDSADSAYQTLVLAEAGLRGTDWTGDDLTILCSAGSADTADSNTTGVYFNPANWSNPPDSLTIKSHDDETIGATFDTGKYRFTTATNGRLLLRLGPACPVTIEKLQLEHTATNGSLIYLGSLSVTRRCRYNILQATGSGGSVDGIVLPANNGTYHVHDNVIYDCASDGIDVTVFASTGTFNIYNNTIYGCGDGIETAGGTIESIENNLCYANTTDYNINATVTNSDNNLSQDATSPDTNHQSKTVDFANTALDDYQTSDDDVVGLGTDLSASYDSTTVDILGVDRGTSWDIGAFQNAASGTPLIVRGGRVRFM